MKLVRVAAIFISFTITHGSRVHELNVEDASVAEDSDGELDVNEFADLNTKAFLNVNATSGVCRGRPSPPSCCCKPVASQNECRVFGQSFHFHPKMMPYDKGSSATRTCYPKNLCCHQSAKGKCATKMLVKVVSGDNNEKHKKTYVKIWQKGSGTSSKTGTSQGRKGNQWNDKFYFNSLSHLNLEVKWQKTIGTGTYGTHEVSPPFWSTATQTVTVKVPQYGMLTLHITPTLPQTTANNEVDDDYDPGLCSSGKSASFLQSAGDPIDDFLAELDGANPRPAPVKDEPVFLNVLNHRPNQMQLGDKFMTRDYTLIIDRSGSMGRKDNVHVPHKIAKGLGANAGNYHLARWTQVDGALQYLAPYVVAEDPDGVGVYFFDSRYDKAENICEKHQVVDLFKRNRPGGRTMLAQVLEDAMEPDTVGRAETIFVLTDGEATDPQNVARAIVGYTHKMCKPEMLSISFIQVGGDSEASRYLNRLDDDLENEGAKFDIVDAMTKDEMQGKSFLDVVELSVYD